MTDFTNIRTALSNLLEAVADTATELTMTANAQRKELISLYARIRETNKDLAEFGAMIGEVGSELLDIEDTCEDVAMKATTAIESGADFVPECDYEYLVEFCDECGRAIAEGEEYDEQVGGWFVCADCMPKTEPEQLTVLDETTETTEETSAE